jgi:hypothetical protein
MCLVQARLLGWVTEVTDKEKFVPSEGMIYAQLM